MNLDFVTPFNWEDLNFGLGRFEPGFRYVLRFLLNFTYVVSQFWFIREPSIKKHILLHDKLSEKAIDLNKILRKKILLLVCEEKEGLIYINLYF